MKLNHKGAGVPLIAATIPGRNLLKDHEAANKIKQNETLSGLVFSLGGYFMCWMLGCYFQSLGSFLPD